MAIVVGSRPFRTFAVVDFQPPHLAIDSRFSANRRATCKPRKRQAIGRCFWGSTINQAGRDVVINTGISEEAMKNLLHEQSHCRQSELSHKYPFGYLLFGVANGNVVFQPNRGRDFRFNPNNRVSITIDSVRKSAKVSFPFSEATLPNINWTIRWDDLTYEFAYVENEPNRFPIAIRQETGTRLFLRTLKYWMHPKRSFWSVQR